MDYAECWQRCRLLAVEPELRRWQESHPGEDYFASRESDQRKHVEGRVLEESRYSLDTKRLYNANDIRDIYQNMDCLPRDQAVSFEEWAVFIRAKNSEK